MGKNTTLSKNQKGMVSIIVTMIIMIVLSLIVISFAQLIRREQRQVLDRQLNSQAFYAAESGINDAVAVIKSNPNYSKPNCSGTLPAPYSNKSVLDSSSTGVISYSCLIVDPSVPNLEKDDVAKDASWVVPVIPVSSITDIYVSWQDKAGGTNFSGCAAGTPPAQVFPPTTWRANCSPGVLRVDLVPIPNPPAGFNRGWLTNNQMTAFLYPLQSGPTSFQYKEGQGFTNQGVIKGIQCNNSSPSPSFPMNCKAQINLTGVPGAAGRYYLRLKSIYKDSAVKVYAQNGGAIVNLTGAQVIVDSTGKANDVLKRIQVRVPVSSIKGPFPEFPIETLNSLCKRYGIAPPDHVDPSPIGGDPACNYP